MDNLVQSPSRASISGRHASPTAPAKLPAPAQMAFPTPYQIGMQRRLQWAQMERSQLRVIALKDGAAPLVAASPFLASEQTTREEELACDREYALRDLMATLTATNMADAGVQVCQALEIVVDLEASEHTAQQRDSNIRTLRRLLASILPVVRAASEYPLEAAVEPWALDAPLREFSVLESGA